jgi:hypothetical protein
LSLEGKSRQKLLETLTLRQLHRVVEMTLLATDFGDEVDPKGNPKAGHQFLIELHRAEYYWETLTFFEQMHERIHGDTFPPPRFRSLGCGWALRDYGYKGFVILFDHFQHDFRNLIVGLLNPGKTPRYDEYMKKKVWGECEAEQEYALFIHKTYVLL